MKHADTHTKMVLVLPAVSLSISLNLVTGDPKC